MCDEYGSKEALFLGSDSGGERETCVGELSSGTYSLLVRFYYIIVSSTNMRAVRLRMYLSSNVRPSDRGNRVSGCVV